MPQITQPWNSATGLREAAQVNFASNSNSATAATTLTAAQMTGGWVGVDLAMTGTLAAGETATTDTAANLAAAVPTAQRYVGYAYKLRITNKSSGAFSWTVAGGTGVTVTGTATIAQNTWREFLVTFTALGASPAVTLLSLVTGTYS